MKLSIDEIVKCVGGRLSKEINIQLLAEGVSTDTRNLKKGELFVPLAGERFDGHSFAKIAEENGALVSFWDKTKPVPAGVNMPLILVEDTLTALQHLAKYYRDKVNPIVIGVTGSNGKTTTKDLITAIISTKYKVHKTVGNLNNHIGLPLTLLSMPADTEVAVAEMGMSNKGEIEFLSAIVQPDIAVVTNIGESHLEFLKSRENIAKAKLEILKGLKADGWVVLLGDEPLLRQEMTGFIKKYKVRWVGKSKQNDNFPINIELDTDEIRFTDINGDSYRAALLGIHNVINTLIAIEVGKILNISVKDTNKALSAVQLTGMRLEKMTAKNGSIILNDAYNASPTSMSAGLSLLASLNNYNKKIAVLGDMLELGKKAETYHREIGEFCSKLKLNLLITTGKLGKWIADAAREGGMNENKVYYIEDLNKIADLLLNNSDSDTIILVKGSRGVKLEKLINELI